MLGNAKRRLGLVAIAVSVVLIMLILSGTVLASSPMSSAIGNLWGPGGFFTCGPSNTDGYGPGMMGGGHGPGMMGQGGGWINPRAGSQRQSADQVRAAVQNYLAANYNNPDLVIAEIMEFQNNFYAEIEEQSTGLGAFELLIDPYTGYVWPEYGPNMMWNTKYGHMAGWGGMMPMHSFRGQPTATMPIPPQQAGQIAQRYLDAQRSGLRVEETPDTFYGYYTLHTLHADGSIEGMLSVNGYTGQVWYHSWHGQFIGMVDDAM